MHICKHVHTYAQICTRCLTTFNSGSCNDGYPSLLYNLWYVCYKSRKPKLGTRIRGIRICAPDCNPKRKSEIRMVGSRGLGLRAEMIVGLSHHQLRTGSRSGAETRLHGWWDAAEFPIGLYAAAEFPLRIAIRCAIDGGTRPPSFPHRVQPIFSTRVLHTCISYHTYHTCMTKTTTYINAHRNIPCRTVPYHAVVHVPYRNVPSRTATSRTVETPKWGRLHTLHMEGARVTTITHLGIYPNSPGRERRAGTERTEENREREKREREREEREERREGREKREKRDR